MLKRGKYIFISIAAGFLFTVFIYNVKVFLHIIFVLYESQIFIHIAVTVFYYLLYLLLSKKLTYHPIIILGICVFTPIFIDASVLITNTEKIPMRFPFSSLFPLLGSGLGILKRNKQKGSFLLAIIFISGFMWVSYKFIIPKISFYSFKKNTKEIVNNNLLFQRHFYTADNREILLQDTVHSKLLLVECFFDGCSPCEIKRRELEKLRKVFSKKDLAMVFICDGSITSIKDFKTYSQLNEEEGFIYLYDKDSVLSKGLNIKAYPMEFLTYKNTTVNTLSGFDESISAQYFTDQFNKIKNLIVENNN